MWERKWLIVIIIVLFTGGSIAYALTSQHLYTATATVMPVGNTSQTSTLARCASLASSVGISLSGGSSGPPDQHIMAILVNRSLAEQLVKELDLVPIILKDPKASGVEDPFQTAVTTLRSDDLNVSEDSKTSLISIVVAFPEKTETKEIANHAVSVLEKILNKEIATLSLPIESLRHIS